MQRKTPEVKKILEVDCGRYCPKCNAKAFWHVWQDGKDTWGMYKCSNQACGWTDDCP